MFLTILVKKKKMQEIGTQFISNSTVQISPAAFGSLTCNLMLKAVI